MLSEMIPYIGGRFRRETTRNIKKCLFLILQEKYQMCNNNMPDNYDFFKQHEAEQESKLEERPLCDCCEEPIQDDFYYDIGGEIYCENCMVSCFRKTFE